MAPDRQNNACVVVGVADLAVARAAQGKIITYALGSCIGITAWDPQTSSGGMLHFMLPQPGDDTVVQKPGMYATSGIPLLFRKLADLGVRRERLIVCAAGGAEVISDSALFAIGKRNRTIMRKLFWKDDIKVVAEDTGGDQARTMTLHLASGEVTIKTRNGERSLWAAAGRPVLPGGKS